MPGPKSKRRLLHKGMGGEDVRDVQRKLNARRVNVLDEAGKRARPLEVDGKFGTDTEKAVRLFQGRNHLEPSGNIDDRTWDALNTVLAVATVTAEPRPKFGSLLNHMLDEAEKGLKGRDGRISLRMRQPGSERNTPGPYLRPPDSIRPIPGGDRIYQIQGQQGRVLQPFPTGPSVGLSRSQRRGAHRRKIAIGSAVRFSSCSRTSSIRNGRFRPAFQCYTPTSCI